VPIEEEFTFGNGGWVRYVRRGVRAVTFVRFVEREGRFVVADVFVTDADGSGAVSATDFRKLSLGRIETFVNSDDSVRNRLNMAGPLLRTAVSHFLVHSAPRGTWVDGMLRSQFTDSGEPFVQELDNFGAPDGLGSLLLEAPDATLEVPTRRPYPDDFFAAVAAVYRVLLGGVHNPTGFIADQNHVPLTTAQRWVREARSRGHLPKASHGKAG
jgi:hypothetical protein